MFNNIFFENLAVCKVMWKNIIEPDRLQMKMWRMSIICRFTEVTRTKTHNM